VLHRFGAAVGDGQQPQVGLIEATDGTLYGTTGGTTGSDANSRWNSVTTDSRTSGNGEQIAVPRRNRIRPRRFPRPPS
jgi:hypothetical protein